MKFYYFEYESIVGNRQRSKDIRNANSKAHLLRILDMLDIDVIKNSIKEVQ